ncbi:NMD pathway component [Sarracenia purpurea var. burkii]
MLRAGSGRLVAGPRRALIPCSGESLFGGSPGLLNGHWFTLLISPTMLSDPSQKHQSYARAYIDFKRPEDVIEFAEFFNGHVFVNEKGVVTLWSTGTQFRTIVEYAPSQRIPKQWSKEDGREGTIFKDPAYVEFLEFLAKPVENLPSAEIQLERREVERAGAAKDAPIVTPLMDFVRQKRTAKGGTRVAIIIFTFM